MNLEEKGARFRGKTLLRSSKSENDDEKHHHELLRYSGMKIRMVEQTMTIIWQIFKKDIWLMMIHSYVKLRKEFRIAPWKLGELGKILGKDLWVRAHSKYTPSNNYLKGRLHRLIKWLEWDNNLEIGWTDLEWKDESSEISSALQITWIERAE